MTRWHHFDVLLGNETIKQLLGHGIRAPLIGVEAVSAEKARRVIDFWGPFKEVCSIPCGEFPQTSIPPSN
jgi:hypothetical protein